jgi:hypothetical protein
MLKMGKVARVVASTHVGKWVLASVDQDLLPLPAPEKELSESRLARDNVTFSNPRKDFPTVSPLSGASSWVHVLGHLLNYMWLGWGPADDCILRLILNAIPTNEVQFIIPGEVQFELRKDLHQRFFTAAPDGQDFFEQFNARFRLIADRVLEMAQDIYRYPVKSEDGISALGLRHEGYAIPAELFSSHSS